MTNARLLVNVTLVVACLLARSAAAQIEAQHVKRSISRSVEWLKGQQNKAKGNWPGHPLQAGGVTSLCTLALLNAGVDKSDPQIQAALAWLRALGNPRMTYATSLQTMVFCAAEPQKDRLLISRNARWLESTQIVEGEDDAGGWGYKDRAKKSDNSNAQFALLALHEAERAGVKINDQTWRRALGYWLRQQKDDGSWGYKPGMPSLGSMTCAGIASVVIASGRLSEKDAQVLNGTIQCCGEHSNDDAVAKALIWLGLKFRVDQNPNMLAAIGADYGRQWLFYYLYGVERVGRLTARRYFYGQGRTDPATRRVNPDPHDWYREGAEFLLRSQDELTGYWKNTTHGERNPLVATSLALLFLSKGRRPVVISKARYGEGNGWNSHRQSLQNLTHRIERRWKRDLTWQTIDLRSASLEDLLQTPVLFISGRSTFRLDPGRIEAIKEYVNQGGFIFAEACCGDQDFDRSFRALLAELFPDSKLRFLPADHAVWFAEQKVDPQYQRPLYGLDACCRTSVVYCPQDLSCLWELSEGDRTSEYPQRVQDEIEACLRIGENVVAYATNRELKDKLDRPQFLVADAGTERLSRATLFVPKIAHSGGSDDAPNALSNLLNVARGQVKMRLSTEHRVLSATDETLYEYPIVFMHGRRDFRFNAAHRQALRTYIDNGGFLFADSICASRQFTEAFRREMQAIFPESPLQRIRVDHPLFTPEYRGYDVRKVTLRDPQLRNGDEPLQARMVETTPVLEGITVDDRLVVVFSPHDISCAMENHASLECLGYVRKDAARIGVNVILYALQQ